MGTQGRHRLSGAGRGAPVWLTGDPADASSIPHTSQSAACMGDTPAHLAPQLNRTEHD
jgi:hypothetical protein